MSLGFIKSTFPPLCEIAIVDGVAQTLCIQSVVLPKVEYRHLLVWKTFECSIVKNRLENAVIGKHSHIGLFAVVDQKADVAKGMIFALTCGSNNSYMLETMIYAISCSFGKELVSCSSI